MLYQYCLPLTGLISYCAGSGWLYNGQKGAWSNAGIVGIGPAITLTERTASKEKNASILKNLTSAMKKILDLIEEK